MRFHRVRVVRRCRTLGRGFTQGLIAMAATAAAGLGVDRPVRRVGAAPVRARLGADVPRGGGAAAELFGEGICRVGGGIWQLTWRERAALRWDAATLELREKVRYNREGWGMCAVGQAPEASATCRR